MSLALYIFDSLHNPRTRQQHAGYMTYATAVLTSAQGTPLSCTMSSDQSRAGWHHYSIVGYARLQASFVANRNALIAQTSDADALMRDMHATGAI